MLAGIFAVSFFAAALRGAGAMTEAGADGAAGFTPGMDGADGGTPGGFGAPAAEGIPGGFGIEGMLGGFGRLADGGTEGGVGGTEPAPGAGTGFGGRLIVAVSRGVSARGWPSRRGGRTIRTVSFLGSAIVVQVGAAVR